MTQEFSVIGKPVPMKGSYERVTGRAKYTADLTVPGLLHGKILRSPHAHANILNIDASRAERLPGVKAIVTAKDGTGRKYGQMAQWADEYMPALQKVRYVGEGIAAVAAVDLDTAEEALELIDVEYEVLPAVFDPYQAMEDGAPVIHDHVKNNISREGNWHFGDVDAAFAACDVVREDFFSLQACTHAPMEPHTVLANWEPGNKLTMWASTQGAAVHRHNLAWALGLPESNVRVIPAAVGGGFGGKMELYVHDVCASLLSRKAGRPVLIALTREEELCAAREKHPMSYRLKTGMKKDGTLLAREVDMVADGGAYLSIGALTMILFGSFMLVPYKLPNFRYHYRRAYTNKTPRGALRGHGIPQANFGTEIQMDKLAEDLGIDPVDLRRKNAIVAPHTTPNGFIINSAGLLESIDYATTTSEWTKKRGRGSGAKGIGIACNSFLSGNNFSPHLLPTVNLNIDYGASVTLFTGAVEIGQGSHTVVAMIVAEELGLKPDDVLVVGGDTAETPPDSGAYSSRTTVAVGRAAFTAAQEVKKQIFPIVAQKLECNSDDLEARDGRIQVKGSAERGVTWRDAIRLCFSADILPIVVKGSSASAAVPPVVEDGYGNISPAYTFAAQIVELDVDRKTGVVKIAKVSAAHDCGRAINPLTAEGQVHGSLANALGMAAYEDMPRDQGAMLNSTFLNYRLSTALETPAFHTHMVETNDPYGPYGAKESGESLQVPTAAAMVSALHDALGIWITDLPITPEKVLAAIEAKEGKDPNGKQSAPKKKK